MMHPRDAEASDHARRACVAGEGGLEAAPPGIFLRSRATREGTLAVELAGEVDHFTCAPLRALLFRAAEDGHRHLVLDTARVTFADSGLLAALAPWCRRGHQVTLVNPSRTVQLLLDTMSQAGVVLRSEAS